MNNINFNPVNIDWINNSLSVISWINDSSNVILWQGTGKNYSIRMADFVRVVTPTETYRFATTPSPLTIPEVDAQPFEGLGQLVKIGEVQRDIKSTANETTITLIGLDTAVLGWVLGHEIKGAFIEMWHGFFTEEGALIQDGPTGGLYKFFTGYISSFSISENWMEELRMYVGSISVAASSTQIILQNRTAGRYTNDNSWQFFNPGDTSMDRVAFIQGVNYFFGKSLDPSVYKT
jgi:hypothetical protein